jgi:hypothetical protein
MHKLGCDIDKGINSQGLGESAKHFSIKDQACARGALATPKRLGGHESCKGE